MIIVREFEGTELTIQPVRARSEHRMPRGKLRKHMRGHEGLHHGTKGGLLLADLALEEAYCSHEGLFDSPVWCLILGCEGLVLFHILLGVGEEWNEVVLLSLLV